MTTPTAAAVTEPDTAERATGLAVALRQSTSTLHAEVDAAVMAARPLEDRERYGRFVTMQYRFHQLTPRLFQDEMLNTWFPGLASRDRLSQVEQDCRDLGLQPAQWREPPLAAPRTQAERATAVGWLYVIEGSNLGAAFLYKRALLLGMGAGFGARHLAPHPDGRALHWHQFVDQLNAVPLVPREQPLALEGARQAFSRVIEFARAMTASA